MDLEFEPREPPITTTPCRPAFIHQHQSLLFNFGINNFDDRIEEAIPT
jgi:hypothetical protein